MNDSLIPRIVLNAFRLSPQVVNKQLRADYEQSKAESAADRRSQSETKKSRSVAGTALLRSQTPNKKSTLDLIHISNKLYYHERLPPSIIFDKQSESSIIRQIIYI